jgi:hypothetical protein
MLRARRRWVKGRDVRRRRVGSIQVEGRRLRPLDHGGTEAQFIELVKARDRLLASLGTRAAAPKTPEFAPKGARLRYGKWRPNRSAHRLGHTQRLAG